MFTTPITDLIALPDGTKRPDFESTTPEEWARRHMLLRYNQVYTDDDPPGSFPHQCFEKLKEERSALDSWFDEHKKFSPTLQSVFMINRLSGPIDDGIGWDFKSDRTPEQRMLVFKGTLLAAWRSAALIAPKDRVSGNMQLAGLATLIRSAYLERAKMHSWRGFENKNEQRKYDGVAMSMRWVAYQTFLFLIKLSTPHKWAWEISGCYKIFGPIDETRTTF